MEASQTILMNLSDNTPGRGRWYTEPETFIAVAALIVSISAVVVGLYEASLQRHHDRAEVWPRVEIQTFTGDKGATLSVENTGIGPAVIKSATITVDGVAQQNMRSVLKSWLGAEPLRFGQRTIVDHGLRPGDKVDLLSLDHSEMPPEFWDRIGRIGVTICYASVFDDFWIVSSEHLGTKNVWREVAHCPAQAKNTDF
jgi:hypothetical protein